MRLCLTLEIDSIILSLSSFAIHIISLYKNVFPYGTAISYTKDFISTKINLFHPIFSAKYQCRWFKGS